MKKFFLIAGAISILYSRDFFDFNGLLCDLFNTSCQCREVCKKKIDQIEEEKFSLFVKEVKKVESDIVILVQFRSKDSNFDIDLSRSNIVLIDSRGKSITLNGCSIPNFHIYSGESKIFPFVFKRAVNKMRPPYKLKLKLYNIKTIVLKNLRLGMKSVEY